VRVAILGAAGFDPRRIVTSSLRFGRTGWEDSLSTPTLLRPSVWVEDVNGDGRLDLVAEFDVSRTLLRPGDTKGILTGRLRTGEVFIGEDDVEVV
jgi:hypothetical protein